MVKIKIAYKKKRGVSPKGYSPKRLTFLIQIQDKD